MAAFLVETVTEDEDDEDSMSPTEDCSCSHSHWSPTHGLLGPDGNLLVETVTEDDDDTEEIIYECTIQHKNDTIVEDCIDALDPDDPASAVVKWMQSSKAHMACGLQTVTRFFRKCLDTLSQFLFGNRRSASDEETGSPNQIFLQCGQSTIPVTVKNDLNDTIQSLKEHVAVQLDCSIRDFRLHYGGKDLNQGTLRSNCVPEQATIFVVGRLPGGGPNDGVQMETENETVKEKPAKRRRKKKPGSLTGAQRVARKSCKHVYQEKGCCQCTKSS